jgi:hypothetical protein
VTGKQTDALRSAAATSAETARCMSLLDINKQSLDLESDTSEQLSSFLFGLQSLLNRSGRDVMLDSASEAGATAAAAAASSPRSAAAARGAKRFSIMSTSMPAAEKSRYANFQRALLALPEDENMRVMTEGCDFYVWQADESSGRVFRQLQHLYYVPQEASGMPQLRLGAFYWGAVGSRDSNPLRRMVLGDLTDVFVVSALRQQGSRGSGVHTACAITTLLSIHVRECCVVCVRLCAGQANGRADRCCRVGRQPEVLRDVRRQRRAAAQPRGAVGRAVQHVPVGHQQRAVQQRPHRAARGEQERD